jgi:predicted CXXCH cytochrome family protein
MGNKGKILAVLFTLFTVMMWMGSVTAQDEVIVIEHKDVFKEMRRPSVSFPHARHEEALGEKGCGACHHVPDKQTGKLVYEEGSEAECSSCHTAEKQNRVPGLKDAFHQSCTGCHRQMKKADPAKKGPTTCGECHSKKSK